jgi:hypothetical protein
VQVVQEDRRLLVRVGVDLDASLLHQDAEEVSFRVERVSGEVGLHVRLLLTWRG